jgi:sugar O-acyltransferase (sialic acid O-acetyltransferase NeuD family)
MNKPIIVIGAGGHAKVVIDTLMQCGSAILGAVDADSNRHGQSVLGIPVIGNDEEIFKHEKRSVVLINGVGSTDISDHRKNIHQQFLSAGYTFQSLIHPSATLAHDVKIADGAQIMAGVVIQPGCIIGTNTIINTRASIDHDCTIGAHCHIAPGAVLGGNIIIGDGCHIGAGTTIIQNTTINPNVLVGAGATVLSNIADGSRVVGTPARNL